MPEIIVPAGYNQIVYETQYALNSAKTAYVAVPGTVKSMAPHPLPIRAASAYEAATHRRVPPKGFGALPGEP